MRNQHSCHSLILPLTLISTLTWCGLAQADSWANSYTNTNTWTYTNTNTNIETNTNTTTNTNTRTCTQNGVPIDCDTGLPLANTNPAVNCPERQYELIYSYRCDHRITTLRYRPVKIQHAYDGAGFNAGTGLLNAYDMNDNGDVVGQALTSEGDKHAVKVAIGPRYPAEHYFSSLGTPRLINSVATAISNEQTIIGGVQPSIGAPSMVDAIWHSQLGGFLMLNTLGGNVGMTTGLARNSMYTEFVTGYGLWPSSNGGDNAEHGFVWSFDGRVTTKEVIGTNGLSNRAHAINDGKIVVGQTLNGVRSAYWWQSGAPVLLPDYGHYPSSALSLNNNMSAKIVGFAFDATGKKRATVWQNNSLTALPDLPTHRVSVARAITDGGDIVGQSGPSATIWRDGVVFDLNQLLDTALPTTLNKAIDINRQGRILTKGADGVFYVLIPTESL